MVVEQVINRFCAYLLTEKRVSKSTFESYVRDVNQLALFLKMEHNTDLESAKREYLKNYLFFLKMKQSTARTMSRKISAIKVFYNYTSKYFEWENIASDLIFPKLEKKLPQYLTENEIEQLLIVANQETGDVGIRNKVMLYLLYVSGMRISEMVSLVLSQIQFDSNFINVNGKGGKGRIIPIPKEIMLVLESYTNKVLPVLTGQKAKEDVKEKNKESNKTTEKTTKAMRICKTDYLFPVVQNGKVKHISRQAFWGILKKMWEKTGNKRAISPHQLRHSLATHMLKNGADLRSLQMLLGHENLCTVQIYTHLDISYLRDVYNKKHPRA